MLSNGFSVRLSSKLQCRFHAQVYLVNTKLILCGFAFGVCACVCPFVSFNCVWEFLLCYTCYFFILIFLFLFFEDGKEGEGTERKGRRK